MNIIYMIDIKQSDKPGRTDSYQYSINSWKKWAEKNNAQVFVLDKLIRPIEDMRPNWYKFYIFDLLENMGVDYDQILIVDSDTFVHPDCPDFFKLTDGKYTGVHNQGSYDWLLRSTEAYGKYIFTVDFSDFNRYINTGFQIVNENHKPFFKAVLEFYEENKDTLIRAQETFKVGTDQTPINFLLDIYKIPMTLLPYEFNMQDMARNESLMLLDDGTPLFTKFGWVYHFNAIPNNVNAVETHKWLKYCWDYFYGNS